MTLKQVFEATVGEEIEYAILGTTYHVEDRDDRPAAIIGKLLPWEVVGPMLDYDWHRGFGGEDCHPVFAWTRNFVLFVHAYDGATSVHFVPRNPTGKIMPEFGGVYDFAAEAAIQGDAD